MDLSRIRDLKNQIDILNEELKLEQNKALEYFRNQDEVDRALDGTKISNHGVSIQYFPVSTIKTIDTNKLKEDGLYDKYLKESKKSDYVKISVYKED